MMLMYYLIEYGGNYLKTSESLRQYYRDMPGEAKNAAIADSESIKFKVKTTGGIPRDGNTKDVEIVVPLIIK